MNWSLTVLTHILALCFGGLLGTLVGAFFLSMVKINDRDDDYGDDYAGYRRADHDRDRVVPMRDRDRTVSR